MLSFQFKTCITNGRELYAFIEEELNDQQMFIFNASKQCLTFQLSCGRSRLL